MAVEAKLAAEPRTGTGKSAVRKLRVTGRVPAVLYGYGEKTRELSVNAHELSRLFAHISVENTIITLDIEGESAPVKTLVREVQNHPFRSEVVHLDFYQIHAGESISLDVPVRLVGQSKGVRNGGVMDQILYDLHIRCSADSIPEAIEADISNVDVNESVHVRDVVVPDGVTILNDGDLTICTCVPPTVSAAPVVEGEVTPTGSEPELIRKKTDED